MQIRKDVSIVPIDSDNIADINKVDSFHFVASRIVPFIEDGVFKYTIESVEPPYNKEYPEDDIDYSPYYSDPDKTAFLAYAGTEPAGQIIIKKNWNLYAEVEDIRVATKYRKNGIGTRLMDAAVYWAASKDMPGIMLETQDVNVPACRFYENYGFILGGVDKKLYSAAKKYADDTALFWYLIFSRSQ